ncbi:MAG: hypothetical protein R6X12_04615 [bacterium]
MPRAVLDAVGGFPVGVAYGEDTDTWCRIALRYPIAFNSRPLAVYHKDADERACDRVRPLEHPIIRTLEAAIAAGALPPGVPVEDLVEYRNRWRIHAAVACLRAGLRPEARTHLRAAASTRRYRAEWRHLRLRSRVPAPLWNWARQVRLSIVRNARA